MAVKGQAPGAYCLLRSPSSERGRKEVAEVYSSSHAGSQHGRGEENRWAVRRDEATETRSQIIQGLVGQSRDNGTGQAHSALRPFCPESSSLKYPCSSLLHCLGPHLLVSFSVRPSLITHQSPLPTFPPSLFLLNIYPHPPHYQYTRSAQKVSSQVL